MSYIVAIVSILDAILEAYGPFTEVEALDFAESYTGPHYAEVVGLLRPDQVTK